MAGGFAPDGARGPVRADVSTVVAEAASARAVRTLERCSTAVVGAQECGGGEACEDALWRIRSSVLRERLLALEGYEDRVDLGSLLSRHATAAALASPTIRRLFSSVPTLEVPAGDARLVVLLIDELVGVLEDCAPSRARVALRVEAFPIIGGHRLVLAVAGSGRGMTVVPRGAALDVLSRAGRVAEALSGAVVRSVERRTMVLRATLFVGAVEERAA